MKQDPEALYRQVVALANEVPDLTYVDDETYRSPSETLRWIGRLHAAAVALGHPADAALLTVETPRLATTHSDFAAQAIESILYRILAAAELAAPAAVQGSFIPVGNSFDAFAAIGKVLQSATTDLLIIDPYMDEAVLTDFAVLADEKVALRLLSDAQTVKPSLKPAVAKWKIQNSTSRTLEAKLSAPTALHDRLIIVDSAQPWILTQSFKDFANRSPGSITKVDADTSALKVTAYEGVWQASSPI